MATNILQKYAASIFIVELCTMIQLGKGCGQSDLQERDNRQHPVETNRNDEEKMEKRGHKMAPFKGHNVLSQEGTWTEQGHSKCEVENAFLAVCL
jgi:hypothetical protein